MTPLVVDASVAAMWVLPDEPLAEAAAALRNRFVRNEVEAVVPDLFWPEMANLFWRAATRGRVTASVAEAGLAAIRNLDLTTHASIPLCDQALQWGLRYGHPAYDMIYAALAAQLGTEVITADERWVRAVGSRLPVRWLGAI
ncbi:MAG TPA: type II toxin-antitoxin system VapC family toxin [Terriglobales bacterium]|nr:type II toxin-antitoxin system VapC family toxin [Terriglobales bacterium]